MIMTLLNTLTTKITGFDANQWGIFIVNKTIDSLPYLTDKTYNAIIITSPYFGYAFYGTLGIAVSLKLAEFGYNYNYFLSKTISKTPVVSQVSWSINKVRKAFSKEVIDSREIEYYPLFDRVMSKLYLDKISITFDSQNISPVVPVSSPTPIVPNTVTAINTTATTPNPETLVEPQIPPRLFAPEEPVTVLRVPEVQQPAPQIIERFIYKRHEATVKLRQDAIALKAEVENLKDAQIGIAFGQQHILKELTDLQFFNTKEGLNPNLYMNPKDIRRYFNLDNETLCLPELSRIYWSSPSVLNNKFVRICFNKPNCEFVMSFDQFSNLYPSISKAVTILAKIRKNALPQDLPFVLEGLDIRYKIENSKGWFKNKVIDAENCLFYCDFVNQEQISFLEKVNRAYTESVSTSIFKINSTSLLIENFILHSTFSDFEVFLTEKFGSVAVRHGIKDYLGAFENQRLKTIMPNKIVDIPNVLERLLKEESKQRLLQLEKIEHMREARRVSRVPEHSIISETPAATDIITPLVSGSTIVLGASVSTLAQIPISDIWNFIFHLQESSALLSDSHFISAVSQAFPNVQIPVQETIRALDTAHSVVETVVTNSTSSSTSPVAEGSLSVSKINVTSSLSGIVPSFSWGNIAIGIGIVGAVACTYYGIKYGVSVNASDVKEAAEAVVINEDFSEYMKIKTLK